MIRRINDDNDGLQCCHFLFWFSYFLRQQFINVFSVLDHLKMEYFIYQN